MRRLLASASFALVVIAGAALGVDAGADVALLDGGLIDGGAPDVIVVLDGATDAGTVDATTDAATDATADATTDATTDATADANDGAAIKDAKSDVCNPNIEPCTGRADTGPDTDAGDNEGIAENGGCSCNSAPAAMSTAPIAFLLAAFVLMTRRRKR